MAEADQVFLAVDLGAGSGRVMAGLWDGVHLKLKEVHRFNTPSCDAGGYLQWKLDELYECVLEGLRKAVLDYGSRIVSIGVDSWGVDYGLLNEKGELLGNAICYRDARTDGVMDELGDFLGRELIFSETGIQFLTFNTIYQLEAETRDQREDFEKAKRLLFLSDLVNYQLSGVAATERSIASTSQLLNPVSSQWSEALLKTINVENSFLGELVESGTRLGVVSSEVEMKTGLSGVDVIAVAGHDTASAFVAIPSVKSNYAVLNSGTWSILGMELSTPRLDAEALVAGFSNEIGYGGTVRFLKNICGMWLIEESRKYWESGGRSYSYEEIAQMAESTVPFISLIDPDSPVFLVVGDIPSRIQLFCKESDQPVPETDAEIVRCIFDSLALKYHFVFKQLARLSDNPLEGIHVMGGGSQNALLNQMTANAVGVPVMAGPVEATAIGNVIVQMITQKELPDLESARSIIARSFDPILFEPMNTYTYKNEEERFVRLLHKQ